MNLRVLAWLMLLIEAPMSNTIQKYKDYVMTGFLKSVTPIVIDRASGVNVGTRTAASTSTAFPESR